MYIDEVFQAYRNENRRDFSSEVVRTYNLLAEMTPPLDLSFANFSSCTFTSSCRVTGINFEECNFHYADLDDVVFENCNFHNANLLCGLAGTEFINCDLSGTCLDPNNKIDYKHNDYDSLELLPDGRFAGWRTQRSRYHSGTEYQEGMTYTAPYFSTDAGMSCHPGLYFFPNRADVLNESDYDGYGLIKIAFDKYDAMQVDDKWRCRKFEVLEVISCYEGESW